MGMYMYMYMHMYICICICMCICICIYIYIYITWHYITLQHCSTSNYHDSASHYMHIAVHYITNTIPQYITVLQPSGLPGRALIIAEHNNNIGNMIGVC